MWTAFKSLWPAVRPFFANLWTVLLFIVGFIFWIGVMLPPFINADFLTMFIGLALTVIFGSMTVTALITWLTTLD